MQSAGGNPGTAAIVPAQAISYEGPRRGHKEQMMPSSDTAPKIVTACVLIIGNEILSGRTQDANLAFLAQGLGEAGIRLREARVIPDDHDLIVSTVNDV